MTELFNAFCEYQILLKLFHFQTNSYAAHKASDAHLTLIQGHFDRFFEVYQGIFGRIKLEGRQSIKYSNVYKTETVIESTLKFSDLLESFSYQLEDNSDLVNIIDEIVADNNQFLYLLSFE